MSRAVSIARMLDRDLAEEVLRAARRRGGAFAELFVEERSSISVRLDDGKIEELTTGLDRGAGVRVGARHLATATPTRTGSTATALLEAAEAAQRRAPRRGPGAVVDLDRAHRPRHEPRRAAGRGLPAADKVRVAARGRRRGAGVQPRGRAGRPASTGTRCSARLIADLRRPVGRRGSAADPAGRAGGRQARTTTSRPASTGPRRARAWSSWTRTRRAATAEVAASRAVTMLDSHPGPGGRDAGGPRAGDGRRPLPRGRRASARGRRRRQGGAASTAGSSGAVRQRADRTASTTPRSPNGWGSFDFDDEGDAGAAHGAVHRRRAPGVPLRPAPRREGWASPEPATGGASPTRTRRSPRMTNTYILPGLDARTRSCASTERGLYVTSLGGGQVNPATGDFVFGVLRGIPDRGRRGHRPRCAAPT